MARYEVPRGYVIGLVATMPRSGTWLSFYFLEFLDLYLSGRTQLNTRLDLDIYRSLRLAKVHIHSICPGFLEHYDDERRNLWDSLEFYNPGFNYGYGKFIAGNESVFSPVENPAIRIVYIYRNPFDQCVSFFRHAQKHRQSSTRSFIDRDGTEIILKTEREYLRRVGVSAYIKQYFTFHVIREHYPENVFMLPYERLVRDRSDSFRDMLRFFDFDVDTTLKEECFQKALNSSSVESLRNLEKSLGMSLGRDQADPAETHIRSGEIGKWRRYFDESDILFVETTLKKFGLDLAAFEID